MPSVLDDHELDARWRAGLEAASVPGAAVRVDARVAHRVARRRRSRVGAAAGALVVVGALIAGVVVVTGSSDTTRVHTAAPTGGSVFGTVIDGPPPGILRVADAVVTFRAPDLVRREVVGRRIAVVLSLLGPGTWTLRIDDVPGASIPVRAENQLNAIRTLYVDLEPGVHPVTLTGARRFESPRLLHTELEVIAPPAQPAGEPVGSVSVVSRPDLTLFAFPQTVPAGVIEFEYSSEGGTHALVIDGVPGFEMHAPNGDSAKQALKVELAPGQYVLSCIIPGHRAAGEQVTITVT